jgi:hypothetical protein
MLHRLDVLRGRRRKKGEEGRKKGEEWGERVMMKERNEDKG